ncbi:helix-turn-helix domain-containing protein [Actinomadura sp. 6N118]|uniref:helix-turn-helix domain-containing protein n=1 Tax=Actinomadura sp. 6N118 TaxID=3375151 RepID=UPI0037B028C9
MPTERFALALRELHRDAGKPKQQLLAAAMHCSHATVSAILNGRRFPSWAQTEAFIRACSGDIRTWRSKWTEVDREINAELPLPTVREMLPTLPDSPVYHLTGRELYTSLVTQVRQSKNRILTTYMRVTPPPYLEGFTDQETGRAASEYFKEVLAWAARPGAHSARRVICLPNDEMLEWAKTFYTHTRNISRYEVRVLNWQITTDAINIAIFDDVTTFLTFDAGSSLEMGGFRIDDRDFVRASIGYFGRLWSSSTRLSDHLQPPV